MDSSEPKWHSIPFKFKLKRIRNPKGGVALPSDNGLFGETLLHHSCAPLASPLWKTVWKHFIINHCDSDESKTRGRQFRTCNRNRNGRDGGSVGRCWNGRVLVWAINKTEAVTKGVGLWKPWHQRPRSYIYGGGLVLQLPSFKGDTTERLYWVVVESKNVQP